MQDCPVIIHCICYSVYRDLRVINKIADQLARAQQINPWADPATPYSLDNYGVGLLGGATARRGNTPFWFIVRDAISRVQIVYILLRTPLRAVRPGGTNPSVPLEPFFHSELFFFFSVSDSSNVRIGPRPVRPMVTAKKEEKISTWKI